ncbi:MAG: hypothetical protein WDW36_001135 [Sanguina aurantia]
MSFIRPGDKSQGAFGFRFNEGRGPEKKHARPEDVSTSLYGSSISQQRNELPVAKHRREVLYLIEHHATTVVVGETGSGKTTQLPQYLYHAGWAEGDRQIACTQPRRVAASTVATRVAEEMGVPLGDLVGYCVRFDDVTTQGVTKIKYLTDGVLLREMLDDPLLHRYSVIMVDEAHERSLATDLLLGLLKKVQAQRPGLRLVISSATMEADKLRDFFNTSTGKASLPPPPPPSSSNSTSTSTSAPAAAAAAAAAAGPDRAPAIMSIEGRTHPVQVHYLESPCGDYLRAAVEAAVALHCEDLPGDVLIFLSGQEEVEAAVTMLDEEASRLAKSSGYSLRMLPLPLYSASARHHTCPQPLTPLPASRSPRTSPSPAVPSSWCSSQPPRGYRKVVVSTNVAETSLTLEGVVYVIDSCFVKQRCYNPLLGLESLLIAPISKASATQRAGRAGRVRAGHCFRLLTQAHYQQLLPATSVPEMQRSDLTSMVLQLKSLGVDNIMRFAWLAPPPAESMVRALEGLHALGVLDEDARLTRAVGLPLSSLPVDPAMGKCLLASTAMGCSVEMLTLAAMLSVPHIWSPARGTPKLRDEQKAKFASVEGDMVTFLNVYHAWQKKGRSPRWSADHFINHQSMLKAEEVRRQLEAQLRRYCLSSSTADLSSSSDVAAAMGGGRPEIESCDGDMVILGRCVVAGLFGNAAVFEGLKVNPLASQADPGVAVYRLLRLPGSQPLQLRIHPSSVLFRSRPPCLVFHSVQEHDSGWFEMQGVTAVQPQWLLQAAPHMYRDAKV